MDLSARGTLADLVVVISLIAQALPAMAQSARSLSGEYTCAYGCRVTDAAPSVEIDGNAATCMNELGGVFHGSVLTRNSISCFNKVGAVSADGKTILWSDGVVWTRLSGSSQ